MYKRSEITCHGTRDYLTAKWGVSFPNTGFWTYIKYTIVEQHTYPASVLSILPWRDQASVVFGFFQMVGFNRYERMRGRNAGEKCGGGSGRMGDWNAIMDGNRYTFNSYTNTSIPLLQMRARARSPPYTHTLLPANPSPLNGLSLSVSLCLSLSLPTTTT